MNNSSFNTFKNCLSIILIIVLLPVSALSCIGSQDSVKTVEGEFSFVMMGSNFDSDAVEQLKADIKLVEKLLSHDIVEKLAESTIFITNDGMNCYVLQNSNDSYAGDLLIGDVSKYAKNVNKNQPMLMMNLFARAYYDANLSEAQRNSVIATFCSVKSDKYANNYYSNGKKFEIVKKAPDAGKDAISYFAELTEAYLGENDFYPIDYVELERYDPEGFALMESIWGERTIEPNKHGITFPPTSLKQWLGEKFNMMNVVESPLDLYYSKYLLTKCGLPVVASRFVKDEAMVQAVYIIDHMVSRIPESVEAMLDDKFRIGIVGVNENVTDMPESRMMNVWWPGTNWDARGRGYGAIKTIPLMPCGEENIIDGMRDIHYNQSIMVHEFAHNIDHGLRKGRVRWEKELLATYQNAKNKNLWVNSYCGSNPLEYFAVGVQAWFDTAYAHDIKDYNGVLETREQLKEYDKALYDLIATVMPEEKLTGYHFE